MRITNETDEPFCLEPGEYADLGFGGEYEIETDSTRVMSTRRETVRIIGRNDGV